MSPKTKIKITNLSQSEVCIDAVDADAAINAMLGASQPIPCVVGVRDGEPVECGATHSWGHGVWHGPGPVPSEVRAKLLARVEQAREAEGR